MARAQASKLQPSVDRPLEPPTTAARSPVWIRRAATAVAALYLLLVWLDAVRVTDLERLLPRPARQFVQVAELFPTASPFVIDWRVRGWSCATHQFAELDVRPLFPIHRDDKENRFARAMFFYHRERRALEALDTFITRAHNQLTPRDPIGGTMLLSLRIPIPPPGSAEARFQRQPLDAYPAAVERRAWYVTSPDERRARCAEVP